MATLLSRPTSPRADSPRVGLVGTPPLTTCPPAGRPLDPRWLVASFVGGLASGALAKVADGSTVQWAAELGTYPAVWVLAVALLSVTAPTPGAAARRSATAMVAMCLGYYGWAMLVLGFGWTNLAIAWVGVATTVVPIAAALVRWARDRTGPAPVLVMLAMVVMTASDGMFRYLWLVLSGAIETIGGLHLPQAAADIAVIVTLCLLPRDPRTRRWILALAPLAVLAAPNLIDVLLRFV